MVSIKTIAIVAAISVAALWSDQVHAQVKCQGDSCFATGMPHINQNSGYFRDWFSYDYMTNLCVPTSSTMALRAFTDKGRPAREGTHLHKISSKKYESAVLYNAKLMGTTKEGGTTMVGKFREHKMRAKEFAKPTGSGHRFAHEGMYVTPAIIRNKMREKKGIPLFGVFHFKRTCTWLSGSKKYKCSYKANGGHSMVFNKVTDNGGKVENARFLVYDPWDKKKWDGKLFKLPTLLNGKPIQHVFASGGYTWGNSYVHRYLGNNTWDIIADAVFLNLH